jgi:signal peptidase II
VKRSFLTLFGIAGAILAVDQWTKRWATETLAYREPVEVIGPLVRFTYTRNSGVAFGLGAGLPFPYAVFSIVAVAVILYLFLRQRVHTATRQIALALILGGALGNLVDRLGSGEVVDFILIGWRRWYWPVFNVADSAVTIGVVLFGITWMRRSDETAVAHEPSAAIAASPPAHEPHAPPVSPGTESRGAAGSLPRAGADGPVA